MEVEIAEASMNAIANDFLSKGMGSAFIENLDKGIYKGIARKMDPAAFARSVTGR